MKYDATIKELFGEMPALFKMLTGSVITEILNLEFSTIQQRRADLIAWLAKLAGLRPLELPSLIQKEVKEMSITVDLEENPLFAEIFQRREQRGIQLGEQRGRQYGEMTILGRQLEKRFGNLPNWVNSKLEQANTQQLEQWNLQLLDAQTLEEIFK